MTTLPGALRHRVVIEENRATRDATGGQGAADWQQVGPVRWAEINPQSGRELFAAEKTQSEVSVRILVRHSDDIRPHMRVRHPVSERVFDILTTVDPDLSRTWLVLNCRERQQRTA